MKAKTPETKLTLGVLREAMAVLKYIAPPSYTAIVAKPEIFERLRAEFPVGNVGFGIHLYAKTGQVSEGWAFSDDKLLREYLDGRLTEMDLIAMAGNGVKPTG